MSRVGLVVHHQRRSAAELACHIATWLTERGHKARVGVDDVGTWPELGAWSAEALGSDLDVVVSVGGDGTMLRAVHAVSAALTPVLGVNVGHLGYLTEVEPTAWEESLARVLAGDFQIEERLTLAVTRVATGDTWIALNDAVVEKLESGHTVRVVVSVSGRPAISYVADALIVATPTGSTAYNLSAGGPLVSPRLAAMVVTPVAAHSLLGRSIVVAPDEVVTVEVVDSTAVLGVDGQACGRLGVGDAVECRVNPDPARLVTFGERDFWSVLKAKLGLNGESPSSSS